MPRKLAKSEKPPQKSTPKKAGKPPAKLVVDPKELAVWMEGILPQATPQHQKSGVMFMTGGTVFAFTRPAGIAMKLPEARIREIMETRDASFLVMGTKTMREWVLVEYRGPADYRKDGKLLEEAMKFAASSKK